MIIITRLMKIIMIIAVINWNSNIDRNNNHNNISNNLLVLLLILVIN